jgi:site-specific DNA-methyltransferase (adenine-specific)
MTEHEIICADVIEWTRQYRGDRYHAVLSDPPYGLAFMGKDWDEFKTNRDYQKWVSDWTTSMIENVLFPGAVCLYFGGTRTWHRLACGLEDAGFDVVDTVMYLYGSGFPKSHDISKAIDKVAGAEREVVGRYSQSIPQISHRENFGQRYGDEGENNGIKPIPATPDAARWQGYGTALKPAWEPVIVCRAPRGKHTYAELALQYGTGALNIDGTRIEANGEKTGGNGYWGFQQDKGWNANSIPYKSDSFQKEGQGRWPANLILDDESAEQLGDVSRYFYTSKASRSERDQGMGQGERNDHPTLKPIALTEYLARLILPPVLESPRRLFVPFSGSGSEMIGAIRRGS